MNKQSMKWMAVLGLAVAMVCQVQAAGKTELVQRLVTAQRAQIQELSRSMVVGAVQGLMQELNAALGQVPEAKRDAVRAKLEAELRRFVEEQTELLSGVATKTSSAAYMARLEATFTEDELKTVLAWVESPVSKKYGEKMPELFEFLRASVINDSKEAVAPKFEQLRQNLLAILADAGVRPGQTPASAPQPAKEPAKGGKKK